MEKRAYYSILRKAMVWAFCHLKRECVDRLIFTVICAALDWDIPPSELDGMIDEYLDETR